jgi:hypothetical protein
MRQRFTEARFRGTRERQGRDEALPLEAERYSDVQLLFGKVNSLLYIWSVILLTTFCGLLNLRINVLRRWERCAVLDLLVRRDAPIRRAFAVQCARGGASERIKAEETAIFDGKNGISAAGAGAIQPFAVKIKAVLPYERVVYRHEIGRAEDARHLRGAVPSLLGNLPLLDRGISTD